MKFADLLDFIFPKKCLGCGEEDGYLCPLCKEELRLLKMQCCPSCRTKNSDGKFCGKKPTGDASPCVENFSFDQLLVCLEYSKMHLISKMIVQFKYRFSQDLALVLGKIMKHQLAIFSQSLKIGGENLLLVPVPLSEKRLKYRGFNQALVLAEYLVENFSGMQLFDCLGRKDGAQQQAGKLRSERLKNLQDKIFYKNEFGEILKNKNVILVDDIATTGTTLNECAKILKANGAAKVCGLVLARGK
ncbi:ComF family protein [Candidatus Peregrinibacteria bacterium]|nr:ComF family protein [Candidatus Peregrinibacteria bacterium]